MTKEEIWEKECNNGDLSFTESALNAMGEWAEIKSKVVAIGFAKWCQENKQYYMQNDEWSVLENNKAETYKSEQLYDLFLKSKPNGL